MTSPLHSAPDRSSVTVVTAGRPDILACWADAWVRSPNHGRWSVWVGNDGFDAAFSARLAGYGFGIFGMARAGERSRKVFRRHSLHHAMWATKLRAMMQCPTRFCLWLDHDVEVRGDIGPIVDWALVQGKWLAAPFYSSFGTGRYEKKRLTQNGVCFVDTHSPNLRLWAAGMEKARDPNDETGLVRVFGWEAAREGVADLYRPEWYASCDCYGEVHESIAAGTERLKGASSVLRHWCAACGKRAFKALYPQNNQKEEP